MAEMQGRAGAMGTARRRDLDDGELADAGGALRDEWEGVYTSQQVQPERRLQLAVLEDALRILARPVRLVMPSYWRNAREETLGWVASCEEGPFAFVTICEAFAMDPGKLRQRIAALTTAGGAPRQFRVFTRGRQQQPMSSGGNWHLERAARRKRSHEKRWAVR